MECLIELTTIMADVASVVTVFLAWFYARKIVEKRKLDILKEKEWQVVWADNFLHKAIEFNDTLSSSFMKFKIANQLGKHEDTKKLQDLSRNELYRLYELNWDIKNYTLFISDDNKKATLGLIQENLMEFVRNLHSIKGVHDEVTFQKNQFDYSKLIREIHSELLEINPKQKNFEYMQISSN